MTNHDWNETARGIAPVLPREKFATLFNSKLLSAVRILAEEEGRQLQVPVEEAHADLIEKRRRSGPARVS
jgi:hypothetical protein